MHLLTQPAQPHHLLLELEVEHESVDSLAVSPAGGHFAFVMHAKGGDSLYVDGERTHAADSIEQVSIDDSGKATFWCARSGREYVVSGDDESGPWDETSIPDLASLGGQAQPSPSEWSYRAGSRCAFGARDREGRWNVLLRFPAAPAAQEQRPLPATRSVASGPDPTAKIAQPNRYSFVKGSVPVFIGKRDRKECLVVGDEVAGCGRKVSMLAWTPTTGRLAFALETPNGLLVHSGHRLHGPVRNVDWISFSPDGHHLAFLVRRSDEHVLVVDDEIRQTYPLIESLSWLADGRLLVLAHDDEGAHLTLDRVPLLDKPMVSAVYVSPGGNTVVSGKDSNGFFLDPLGDLPAIESLWGEGWLANNRFYAVARLVGGGQALVFDDKVSEGYAAVKGYSVSPDGLHMAAVGGRVDGSTVLLDGEEVFSIPGPVEELLWCGNSGVLARQRAGNEDCLIDKEGRKNCCPRIVFAQCQDSGRPRYLCITSGGYELFEDGVVKAPAWQEVPLHLVFKDDARSTLSFAGRRGEDWYLHIDGAEHPANGKPLMAYPATDGGWYLVQGSTGQRWVGPFGKSSWYSGVKMPVTLSGHSVFAARKQGREAWVQPGLEPTWGGPLASPPVRFAGGFIYLTRADGVYRVHAVLLDAPEQSGER